MQTVDGLLFLAWSTRRPGDPIYQMGRLAVQLEDIPPDLALRALENVNMCMRKAKNIRHTKLLRKIRKIIKKELE